MTTNHRSPVEPSTTSDTPDDRTRATPHYAIETRAVHAGERSRPPAGTPTTTPIHRSATFVYDTIEELDAVFGGDARGHVYSRLANPTVEALETAVAALEGASHCVAFSSGMAALHGALLAAGVVAGDRVVAARDLYAATYTLMNSILRPLGVRCTYVDTNDLAAVETALATGDVRALLVESLSNPLLRVADLPALATLAQTHGATLIVDATFAPPPLGRPLEQGADIVVHSATKYFGGHADITAGVAYGSSDAAAMLRPVLQTLGSILAPNEAWLLLRGIKTLPLRLRRQCLSARLIARHLSRLPGVQQVHFPGLADHPEHQLAQRMLHPGWFGAMIAFELATTSDAAVRQFLNELRLCLPTTSLGDIYTLISCPAMASHRELSPRQCAQMGITPGLMRLSVGIEHPRDLIADLTSAIERVVPASQPAAESPAAVWQAHPPRMGDETLTRPGEDVA